MIEALFVDIGGVLLTNGWDHHSRLLACSTFGLDVEEFEKRHAQHVDQHETDKISLNEYLEAVVFYAERKFTQQQFQAFMFEQSQEAHNGMIDMLLQYKKLYSLKVVALSNEGRELTEYRIKKFNLNRLFDFYVSSCFVHLKKPDPGIYKLALDVTQKNPKQVVYIDDRAQYTQIGTSLGLHSITHTNLTTTQTQLKSLLGS